MAGLSHSCKPGKSKSVLTVRLTFSSVLRPLLFFLMKKDILETFKLIIRFTKNKLNLNNTRA